jgi:type II secretory pathway component PulM
VSTAASRAWLAVAVVGLVVVAIVIALQLVPRLTAGQEVIDAARPALTGTAVKGEVAATNLVARYVDLADPLMTRRGDAERELATLVRLITRKTGLSRERARALLRREAPHTEALLRALPLSGVASERPRLTRLLSRTLNLPAEDLQDEVARTFPRLYETLSELPSVAGGWYDIPGIEAMTRFDGSTRVRTMPALRDYLRDDLVASVGEQQDRFEYLAGWGGIGYIPYLVLVAGIALFAFGLLEARRAANYPPGKPAWAGVVAIGVLLALVVGALQYVPRLDGADTLISKLAPAFEKPRVEGLRAGTDLTLQAVRFGDPIMTRAGGAAQEYPKLVALVAERSGLSRKLVRRRLARAVPRTTALLQAIPLSDAAKEVPHLLAVLSRKLALRDGRLGRMLRTRTPGLTQALLALGPVTAGWEQIPATEGLERFDGATPVRSAPAFADYLDRDLVPVLETQREHYDTLADTWPPVSYLGWLLLGVGLVVVVYGLTMMFLVTKPPPRH